MRDLYDMDPSKYHISNSNSSINIFMFILDKLDLINNLNSIKLLQISEHFDILPNEEADLDQFVKIMLEVLKGTSLDERLEFISDLVDLFYRINEKNRPAIKFQDVTTYLIDHEIAFDAELGTSGGFSASNANALNMEYMEVPLKNQRPHNNYIEKIHYFP